LSISNSFEGSFAWNYGGKTKHYHMGEVEETDGFINDREAEGYKGIDAACDNTINYKLLKHLLTLSFVIISFFLKLSSSYEHQVRFCLGYLKILS
jgi:hypothetical protein